MSDQHQARSDRRLAFEKRGTDAENGLHLPTFSELLRFQRFYQDDLREDAKVYCERLFHHVQSALPEQSRLLTLLSILTISSRPRDYLRAVKALRDTSPPDVISSEEWLDHQQRLTYYSACFGHRMSCWEVVSIACHRAHDLSLSDDIAHDYAVAAVGWMCVGAKKLESWPDHWLEPHTRIPRLAAKLLDRIWTERRNCASRDEEPSSADTPSVPNPRTPEPEPIDLVTAESGPTAIVFGAIGSPTTSEGKRVVTDYKDIVGKPLPLIPIPDLEPIRSTLLDEFPYAQHVVEAVLSDLSGRPNVALRPTVVHGEPGCGKSQFARRLCELLSLPHEFYSCGGVADSSLGGTSRHWATGQPSLPVDLIRRHHCASPAIILDEVEKASPDRRNGALSDALLGLLEPSTAQVWHDPYLQSATDLSHVIWIATANDLEDVQRPLRDRLRCLAFPTPGREHLPMLAPRVFEAALLRRGSDPLMSLPLDQIELDALERHWPGGSLRVLQSMVEAIIQIRDKFIVRH